MITRFSANGQRKRMIQCPPGSKRVGNTCKRMSSHERMDRKRGHIKSARTMKRNRSKMRMANFKRQKALKKRYGPKYGGHANNKVGKH